MAEVARHELAGMRARLGWRLLAIDALFVVPVTIVLLHFADVRHMLGTLTLVLLLFVARVAMWGAHLVSVLRPVERWLRGEHEGAELDGLRAADEALQQFRIAHPRVYTRSWLAFFIALPLLGYTLAAELFTIGPSDLAGLTLFMIAARIGAPAMTRPIAELEADKIALALHVQMSAHGLEREPGHTSLWRELIVHGSTLVFVPVLIVSMLMWGQYVSHAREQAAAQALAAVTHEREPGLEPLAFEALPLHLQTASDDPTHARTWVDVHADRAYAAAPLRADTWVMVELPVEPPWRSFWLFFVILAVTTSVWGFATILGQARSLTSSVASVRAAIRRVTEVGDLQTMIALPVLRGDELGSLTTEFNHLLASLRELTARAGQLARGDLSIRFDGRGELDVALRGMVAQLHGLVMQIRQTSLEVHRVAHQIQTQSHAQELASTQQARELEQLRSLMVSLAAAAENISTSVSAVTDNAERTLATTAHMGQEIASLDTRSQGIGELLELIRDVADRSDILALNGALEATRAGETGRGFALVAGEMRRLAERVTGAVEDVREQVTGIAKASASTVHATEQNRLLAEGTTRAARNIVAQTEHQSGETQAASARVDELVEVAARTQQATSQTRAAADELSELAGQLGVLLDSFELES